MSESAAIIHRLLDRIDALECELRNLRSRLNGDAPACSPPENTVTLTPAQYEVAACILEGMSTSQIARHLQREAATIKSHRRAIRKALGCSDTEGLKRVKARWFRE